MSNPFLQIYPPDPVRLNGGLVNKFAKNLIDDSESPDCLNVMFDEGAAETRWGTSKLNTTSVGSHVCDGLFVRSDQNAATTMVMFAGTHMFTLATTTFVTVPSAQSVFYAGTRVTTAEYENYMFMGQSGLSSYKYNGAYFTSHGVPAPTVTSTAGSQTTGGVTGDYRYKVTYVNSSLVEGDVGPPSATLTVTNATVRLASIPVAPISFGVNARKIYRTETAGTTFKLLATISDNTTTTYDDNTVDASLTTTAPTDNGMPPEYTVVLFHADRLFMITPTDQYVWYSELANPFVVKATNFLRAGDQSGKIPKTLGVHNGSLIIGTADGEKHIVYMPDTDPTNWLIIKSKSPYGSKSPHCILPYDNKLFFPAVEKGVFVGFADFAGDTVVPSATFLTTQAAGSLLNSNSIEPDMANVQTGYLENITGISYKSKLYIALTYGTSQTTNNRIYVFDFSNKDLSKRKKFSWAPWTGLNAAQFCVYGGALYYGSSTATGFVYKFDADLEADDGAAINSYIYTKEFAGYKKEQNLHKDFRAANYLIDLAGSFYMDVKTRVDSELYDSAAFQINLTPGSALYGTAVFGTDVYGAGNEQQDYRHFLGGLRGKRIQFKFSNQNTAGQKFKVHWLNIRYIPGGQR